MVLLYRNTQSDNAPITYLQSIADVLGLILVRVLFTKSVQVSRLQGKHRRFPSCCEYFILHAQFSFHSYPLHGSSRFRICGFPTLRESFGRLDAYKWNDMMGVVADFVGGDEQSGGPVPGPDEDDAVHRHVELRGPHPRGRPGPLAQGPTQLRHCRHRGAGTHCCSHQSSDVLKMSAKTKQKK